MLFNLKCKDNQYILFCICIYGKIMTWFNINIQNIHGNMSGGKQGGRSFGRVNIHGCFSRSGLPSSCWRTWFSLWLTSSIAVRTSWTWPCPKPTERDRNWWESRTSSNRWEPKMKKEIQKQRQEMFRHDWHHVCVIVRFRSLASWRRPSRTGGEGRVRCCVWRSWQTRRTLPISTCSDSATGSSDTRRRTTARTRWGRGGGWWWRWPASQQTVNHISVWSIPGHNFHRGGLLFCALTLIKDLQL